jgi:hypothetical protein
MNQYRRDLFALVVSAIAIVALLVWLVLQLTGCANQTAHVSDPTARFYMIGANEYDLAEAHFAGAEGAPDVVVEYWNDYRCQDLLDKRDNLATWSLILGGLTGIGGISTAATDSNVPQWCLGAASLATGAVSAGLAGAATVKTKRFEQYCNTTIEVTKSPVSDETIATDAGVL